MKKYTLLLMILCIALLAGCGRIGKPSESDIPESSAPSSAEPVPVESEQPSGITAEPPDVTGSKPNESHPVVTPEPIPSEEPQQETEPVVQVPVDPANINKELCGEWFSREADSTGEVRALKLILNENGHVYFDYGIPYREVLEVYEGSWRTEEDSLVMNLYGGPVADDGSYETDYCRDIEVRFRWEKQGIALVCEHTGEAPLLPGMVGEWFTFRPFDAFLMKGTWRAADGEMTEYILQLKENGGCVYRVTDRNGTLQAEYDGTWRYKDGQMSLSVNMCGGAEYDAGHSGQIAGMYSYEGVIQNNMTLIRISGSTLAPDMDAEGKAVFDKIAD